MEIVRKEKQKVDKYFYRLTETDTITVLCAKLPFTDTYRRFLVQILTPFAQVPSIRTFPHDMTKSFNGTEDLKGLLLMEWRAMLDINEAIPEWMKKVDKVELIECDLLVPKKENKPKGCACCGEGECDQNQLKKEK